MSHFVSSFYIRWAGPQIRSEVFPLTTKPPHTYPGIQREGRAGVQPRSYTTGWDTFIPYWKIWVQWLAPVPGSCFLLMWMLGGNGDGSSSWVAVTHVGKMDWVMGYCRALRSELACGRLSLSLSIFISLPFSNKYIFKCFWRKWK